MGFSANDKSDPNREPGQSNMEIARQAAFVQSLAATREQEAIILAQREVAEGLEKFHPTAKVSLVMKEGSGQTHVSSVEVLAQAWEFAHHQGVHDAIIVAHSRHILRATWTAELWGFRVCYRGWHIRDYAPDSTQWWTRGPRRFAVWDAAARFLLVARDYDYIDTRKIQIVSQTV